MSDEWVQPVEDPSPTDEPRQVDRSQRRVRADVRQALTVWREQPALPVMSALFGLVTAAGATGLPGASVLSGLLLITFIGWVGAERLWYLRAFTGRRMAPGEALRWSLRYFGRFFRLLLLAALVMVPFLVIPMVLVSVVAPTDPTGVARFRLGVVLFTAVVTLAFDFALTFVTPALVYSTDKVRDAIRIGLRLLRATWPHAAPYILLPPLAIAVLTRGSGGPLGLLGVVVITLSALLSLLARGVICAYYLRIMTPVGPDGAYSELRHPSYATYGHPYDGT